MELARIGFVARFKPLHKGHASILEALCEKAGHAVIGIGSSNRYDLRNPWTPDETEAMVRAVLAPYSNYEMLRIPDLGNGPRWAALIKSTFGPLDGFVTGNEYVTGLLKETYRIIPPGELVTPDRRYVTSGTRVRTLIAMHAPWEQEVPAPVAQYLRDAGLIDRFRKEFGLATIAKLAEAELSEEQHTKQFLLAGPAPIIRYTPHVLEAR